MKKNCYIILIIISCIVIFGITSKIIYPGIPIVWIFSYSNSNLKGDIFDAFYECIKDEDIGYITSIRGIKNYFAGQNNKVYYLGRKDTFNGIYFIQNIKNTLGKYKIIFFLNYKQISIKHRKNNQKEWSHSSIFRDSIGYDSSLKLEFEITDVPEGKNELCIILSTNSNECTLSDPSREVSFFEQHMTIIQLIRKNDKNINIPSITNPLKKYPNKCKNSELSCVLKGKKVAIVNCTSDEQKGVIFFENNKINPCYYKADKNTVNIFEFNKIDNSTHIYHVSSPFEETESRFFRKELFIHKNRYGI